MKAVVVGAGHAGGQLASALRRNGWEGAITVIGAEPWHPYQRPPLSKKLLTGECDPEQALLYDPGLYDHSGIDVWTDTRVRSIDRSGMAVELTDGRCVEYDYLALATGARVRRLSVPGSDLANVLYLRDMEDALALRDRFRSSTRLVVVGGGYIGLEAAAAAAQMGLEVTVVESAERLMSRVVAPIVSEYLERLHKAHDVQIRTGVSVHGFAGEESVSEVLTSVGRLPCDLVVVGIGIVADTSLAEACGLSVDDGILVDEYARTDDPRILAAGDCTRHPNAVYGRHVRLECVQNASEQAETAARTICGIDAPYNAVPWFWSDQYKTRLQIAGLSHGFDRIVVRGEPSAEEFAVYYLNVDVLIAVDAINSPRDYMMARRLIARKATPEPDRIANLSIPVKSLAD